MKLKAEDLKAGPTLDAIVALEVMNRPHNAGPPPHYSADIAAAWEVLNKLYELKGFAQIKLTRFSEGDGWEVQIGRDGDPNAVFGIVHYYQCWQREGDAKPQTKNAAPLAICIVALKATGVIE